MVLNEIDHDSDIIFFYFYSHNEDLYEYMSSESFVGINGHSGNWRKVML